MPNWTTNVLRLRGPADDLVQFRNRAVGDRELLSFERFSPIPDELCTTRCDVLPTYFALFGDDSQQEQYAYARPTTVSDHPADLMAHFAHYSCLSIDEAEALTRLYRENRATHGHEGWRPWLLQHWSTCRDAREVQVKVDGKTGDLLYAYESATVPPLGALKAMAGAFPELEMTNKFWDECEAYHGVFVLRSGQLCCEDSQWINYRGENDGSDSDDMEGGAA
jgi:hypothetical protein